MRTDNPDVTARALTGAMFFLLAGVVANCTQPASQTLTAAESSGIRSSMANEPALESMQTAKASAKLGVAASLRYSFEGAVSPNQPVTLHLAALPRVEGTNLKVSVKEADGIQLAEGPMTAQKVGSSNVYRKQVSVTRGAGSPTELLVLVTMNVGEDLSFGYFTIFLDGEPSARKQDSPKQR